MKLGILGDNFYQVASLKHKLIFLTPPKCGTYSLKNFLDKGGIQMDEIRRPLSIPFYHATLSEIIYTYDINLNDLQNYKIIQIVRNPYNRFLSSYIHQNKLLKSNLEFELFLSKVEEFKYLLPENLNEFYLNFYPNMGYKWLHSTQNQHGGVRFYYNQSWWNNVDKDININYFKLEDINKDITPLSNLLNITNPYPYSKENSRSYNVSNLEYLKSLIFQYKDRIYNLFKSDFEFFNYKK